MHVCNNFKPPPRGRDQPEKTNAMSHITSVGLKFLNIAEKVCVKTHIYIKYC